MTYKPLHDAIDPEVAPSTGYEYEGDLGVDESDDLEAPSDAFVIGEDGALVRTDDADDPLGIRSAPKPWVKPAAFLLSALFVVLTGWNTSRLLQGPPPPPELSSFQVKQALYLGVLKIDAYRRVNGVTPESLEDVGLPVGGPYSYWRVNSAQYVLAYGGNGAKLEYDSSDSKESFFGSPKEMLTMGETK